MANFPNSQGRKVVLALVQTIVDNKAYLSEVDGKIGDGDHGINMAKGFNLIKDRLGDKEVSLSEGLGLIGKTLMTEIGGSMGPIYGTFFIQMSLKSKNKPETDARLFGEMLKAARDGLEDLGGAKVGDKTLMDAVIPAQEAYQAAVDAGASLPGGARRRWPMPPKKAKILRLTWWRKLADPPGLANVHEAFSTPAPLPLR